MICIPVIIAEDQLPDLSRLRPYAFGVAFHCAEGRVGEYAAEIKKNCLNIFHRVFRQSVGAKQEAAVT